MKIMKDKNGCDYYPELPENARPGHIMDFVERGKKKVGMLYLTYSEIQDVYYINTVREGTTGEKIKGFINAGILYVFTNKNY